MKCVDTSVVYLHWRSSSLKMCKKLSTTITISCCRSLTWRLYFEHSLFEAAGERDHQRRMNQRCFLLKLGISTPVQLTASPAVPTQWKGGITDCSHCWCAVSQQHRLSWQELRPTCSVRNHFSYKALTVRQQKKISRKFHDRVKQAVAACGRADNLTYHINCVFVTRLELMNL